MRITPDWLRKKIAKEPDEESCEAGTSIPEDEDCYCQDGAEDKCVYILCPRK